MKERPILFPDSMVRALLDGRKTQTRRVVKGKYIPIVEECLRVNGKWVFDTPGYELTTPYGRDGDCLWVRETWGLSGSAADEDWKKYHYPKTLLESVAYRADGDGYTEATIERWRPSIHMPRLYSRITLEITGVRVERLQDISNDDALAEGCFFTDYGKKCFHQNKPPCDVGTCPAPDNTHPQRNGWMWDKTTSADQCLGSARFAYANLWESINGEGSWYANPLVWVIEFRRTA